MAASKDPEQRAAITAKKEERARDGAQAMKEYEAEQRAVLAKTERLRALRLAREAAGDAEPVGAETGKEGQGENLPRPRRADRRAASRPFLRCESRACRRRAPLL